MRALFEKSFLVLEGIEEGTICITRWQGQKSKELFRGSLDDFSYSKENLKGRGLLLINADRAPWMCQVREGTEPILPERGFLSAHLPLKTRQSLDFFLPQTKTLKQLLEVIDTHKQEFPLIMSLALERLLSYLDRREVQDAAEIYLMPLHAGKGVLCAGMCQKKIQFIYREIGFSFKGECDSPQTGELGVPQNVLDRWQRLFNGQTFSFYWALEPGEVKKEALAKAAKFPGEGGFWVALTPPSQREGRQNHFLKVLQEKALCLGLSLGLGVTVAWLLTEILQFSLDF